MVLKYSVKFRAWRKDIGKVSGSKAFDLATPKHSFTFGKSGFFAELNLQTYADGSADLSFRSFYRVGSFSLPLVKENIHIATLIGAGVVYNDRGIVLEIA